MLLANQPVPRGNRVGIVTNAGGPAIMASDACESNGLVVWQSAGRSHLYSVDSDNILVTDFLEAGFRLEDALLNRLASIFVDELGRDLASIVLFGSVAREEEKPNSDIDLIVVVRDRADLDLVEDRVAEASMKVARRFGNQAMPIVVKKSEYDKKIKLKSSFWKEVADTGINLLSRARSGQ